MAVISGPVGLAEGDVAEAGITPLKTTEAKVVVQLGILTREALEKASHFPPVTVRGLFTAILIGPAVSVMGVEPIRVVGAVPSPLSS